MIYYRVIYGRIECVSEDDLMDYALANSDEKITNIDQAIDEIKWLRDDESLNFCFSLEEAISVLTNGCDDLTDDQLESLHYDLLPFVDDMDDYDKNYFDYLFLE